METAKSCHDGGEHNNPSPPEQDEAGKPRAWELIEAGRYQPRRIKGSLLGRELG